MTLPLLLLLAVSALGQPPSAHDGRIAPDPRFVSGEMRNQLSTDVLRTRAMDTLTSPAPETMWVLEVWLETLRALDQAREWGALRADQGPTSALAQITALVDDKLTTELIESLAPPEAPEFTPLALESARVVGLLMAEDLDDLLRQSNELRARLTEAYESDQQWAEVIEQPEKLTPTERQKRIAALQQERLQNEVKENVARSVLEQLEFRARQWDDRLREAEAEFADAAARLGLSPEWNPSPVLPPGSQGADPELVDAYLRGHDRTNAIRANQDTTRSQIEEARRQLEDLAETQEQLRAEEAAPRRDLSSTTPEQVRRQAEARRAQIRKEIRDLEALRQELEPAAERKRQEVRQELAGISESRREQARQLVPAVRLIMRELDQWEGFARTANSNRDAINRLRLKAEELNIPVNP